MVLPTSTRSVEKSIPASVHPSASEMLQEPSDDSAWITDVYSLVARKCAEQAADLLFRKIDLQLRAAEFQVVDGWLRALDLKRLDSAILVAILGLTRPAAAQLKLRAAFVNAVRKRLLQVEPDRAERLLQRVV
jgi:hypothetical protein